jgi:DOPA 4,5-dioxygenase
MTEHPRKTGEIASYHAHVYFHSPEQRARAAWIREAVAARFRVRMGQWRETPVGPHGAPMYQIAFETALFASLVPWLMLNRHGLSVLVHPNTTEPRSDHLDHALWLGERVALFGDRLPVRQDIADEAGEPNTAPSV